jgi:hypothetical protein
MPIHIGTDVTVTVRGSVLMTVRCQRCQHVYFYEMFRSEPGGSFSLLSLDNEGAAAKGEAIAQVALRQSLEKGCDPVPCPECGTYQPNMLPQLRHEHRRDLRKAGVRILLAAGLCFALTRLVADPLDEIVPNWITWMAWAAASLAGAGLIVYRWYLGSRHDPNSRTDIEHRKEIGRQRVAEAERYIAPRRTEDNQQPGTRDSRGVRAEPSAAAVRPRDDSFSEFPPPPA